MNTISLKKFLGNGRFSVVVRQQERVVNKHPYVRIFETTFVASIRSSFSESYHFMDGTLVEGLGKSRREAFENLISALNQRVRPEGEMIAATTPDRLSREVDGYLYFERVDGGDGLRRLNPRRPARRRRGRLSHRPDASF